MTATSKKECRRYIRSLFKGADIRAAESDIICRYIMESRIYKEASIICGYIPLAHEADITPVLANALVTGKTLALPLCGKAPLMSFRKITDLSELSPGAYGIPEPPAHASIILSEQIDLLLVPLEAIDHEGYRLGKGGGYYDHMLTSFAGCSLGCALSWQLINRVPRDLWDCPLSAGVSSAGIKEYGCNTYQL